MFPIPPSAHPWLPGIWTHRVEEPVSQHSVQWAYGPAVPQADEEDVPVSAANRLIGEVVQLQRRPLLGPSPG